MSTFFLPLARGLLFTAGSSISFSTSLPLVFFRTDFILPITVKDKPNKQSSSHIDNDQIPTLFSSLTLRGFPIVVLSFFVFPVFIVKFFHDLSFCS